MGPNRRAFQTTQFLESHLRQNPARAPNHCRRNTTTRLLYRKHFVLQPIPDPLPSPQGISRGRGPWRRAQKCLPRQDPPPHLFPPVWASLLPWSQVHYPPAPRVVPWRRRPGAFPGASNPVLLRKTKVCNFGTEWSEDRASGRGQDERSAFFVDPMNCFQSALKVVRYAC